MDKSEKIGNLAKSLANVQKQLEPAHKDAANPFFKSKYSTLNSVWDACRTLLADNGLSVVQVNIPSENGVIIETVLMHESDEWISGALFLPLTKQDAQGVGSAISYGRRYALASMIGVVADDDDGNAASQKPQHQPNRQNDTPSNTPSAGNGSKLSEGQGKAIFAISKAKGVGEGNFIDSMFPGVIKGELTMKQASEVIEALNKL